MRVQGSGHRAQRRVPLVVGAVALTSIVLALIPAVAAQAGVSNSRGGCVTANGVKIKANPQVCKGLAFYRGKTMSLINIASIGGPFYNVLVAEQPYLEQYLGLAGANITGITTGNSIPGQDLLAHATPDGLTIGVLNTLNDVSLLLTNTPGINFSPSRLAYLDATGPSASPLITTPNSGYSSWAQVYAACKAGTLKMLTQSSGTANTELRVWFGALGCRPQWVSGYSSLSIEFTGLLRGDGPIGDINLSTSCSSLQAHQTIALAVSSVPPLGTNCRAFLTSVPTWKLMAQQYGKTRAQRALWKILLTLNSASGTPTVTQTAVAGYKIEALRAALQWTAAQTGYKTAMYGFGLNPLYGNPVVAKTNYINLTKNAGPIACYIQATC
jgi:hypothetical protein